MAEQTTETIEPKEPVKTPRLTSLDAFRGATVALMLIVNNMPLEQATPAQFQHAAWGEWIHLADLVFPWFLLCAGLSLPFSYRSAMRRGITTASWTLKALSRAVGLLLLGMFLDSAYNRQPTFGLGVLQLIGLASFVAALLMPLKPFVRGILAAAAILGYGAALALLPVPDQGRRVLSEHANLVLYLNDTFFKEVGLRGLPSVLPTSALVVLGSLVGGALAKAKRRVQVIGCGFVLALIGAVWSRVGHPMSKDIWTAPYILYSGGIGTMIVAALSWLLDGRPWAKLAAPFLVFGMNPLVAYAGPIMVKCLVLQSWTFDDGRTIQQAWTESMVYRFGIFNGSWLYTLEYVLATWIVLVWLRRRGVVLRL